MEGIQEQHDPLPTGVHHGGVLQLGEPLCCPCERTASFIECRLEDGSHVDRGIRRGGLAGSASHVTEHREDGALDWPANGATCLHCRVIERRRQFHRRESSGGGEPLADPAQDLGKDHARVSPRSQERCARDGRSHVLRSGPHWHRSHGGDDRLLSHEHVGPCIAVRDGVDVEGIDLVAVEAKLTSEDLHTLPEGRRVEGPRHQNRR